MGIVQPRASALRHPEDSRPSGAKPQGYSQKWSNVTVQRSL